MSNQFSFEELQVPKNGLNDVRLRARRIAFRARVKQLTQTVVATVLVCITLLVTGVLGSPNAQLADGNQSLDGQVQSGVSGMEAPTAAPSPMGESGDPTPPNTRAGDEFVTSNVSVDTPIAALVAAAGVLILAGGLFALLRRRDEVSSRPRFGALALVAVGTAMTVIGFAKSFL